MPRKKAEFHRVVTVHDFKDCVCPICGKNFIPAPYHAWKTHEHTPKLVCSRPCDMKDFRARKDAKEKAIAANKEKRKAKYRAAHPLHIENISPDKWALATACGYVKATFPTLDEAQQALDQYNNNK